MNSKLVDVIVVGGGIAGLTAARYCQRAGLSVVVLDPRPGGRATSDIVDGFVFNRGPHALYNGGASQQVLSELGIELTGGAPALGHAQIVAGGAMFALPYTPRTVFASRYLGMRDKAALARFYAAVAKTNQRSVADRSVGDWLDGLPRRAAAILRLAIRTATYCANVDSLSAELGVTALQLQGVRYLDGGWQHLVDRLSDGLDIRPLTATRLEGTSVVATDPQGETQVRGRHTVVAVNSPGAAASLLERADFNGPPAIEAASLDLGLRSPPTVPFLLDVDEPLYCSQHGLPAQLGQAQGAVVHVARYVLDGERHEPRGTRDSLEAFARRAGIDPGSITTSRYLHRMTVCGWTPTAASGGLPGRPVKTDSGIDGVLLAGDWVGPIGHLADAAFASGRDAGRHICATMKR